jgi:hypothetical protein
MNGKPGGKAYMILLKDCSNNMEPVKGNHIYSETVTFDKFHYGINYRGNRIAFEKSVFYNFIIQEI